MKGYKFSGLRQKSRWISPAYVTADQNGIIKSIEGKPNPEMRYEDTKGLALPAFINTHSHAFQYAMAGMAEVYPKGKHAKDFWSWRSNMYEIALTVGPDEIQHIAAMLYSEMVRHGYSHIVEFHYLHHDKDGKPYSNIAETGERLIEAAAEAGINITLVPVLYERGGFEMPPEDHQRRFVSSIEQYYHIIEGIKTIAAKSPHVHLGYGAHSLRAVGEEPIRRIIDDFKDGFPFHIHIAEQLKEIEEAQHHLKKRPVEWLMDNFNINENYHLVHATHLTEKEAIVIASSGANVILCPTTEGNLGDGIFPFRRYRENNGRWCIGTDSHIGLNPLEEIRLMDYGQRLISHKRNTFVPGGGDNAAYALEQVIMNGKKAAGTVPGEDFFEIDKPLDAVVVDGKHPLASDASPYQLSTILYHFDASNFFGTIINGKWVVKGGEHMHQHTIHSAFSKTLEKLKFRNR